MWIQDVVVLGEEVLAAWRAALRRMVELPPMLPLARPRMCMVTFVVFRVGLVVTDLLDSMVQVAVTDFLGLVVQSISKCFLCAETVRRAGLGVDGREYVGPGKWSRKWSGGDPG